MAALGKILRKGAGVQSVHQTAQYERLNQDPDNEEEEDDILFIQEGSQAKQNGFTHTKGHKDGVSNGRSSTADNGIELSELGIQKAKIRPASEVEVRVMKRGRLTRMRIACFVLTMLLAIGIVLALVFFLPHFRKLTVFRTYEQSPEWNTTFNDYGTESLVRLVDVDEDGRLDILFSMMPQSEMGFQDMTRQNGTILCKQRGYKSYPCVAQMRAFRGHDHALLWEFSTHSSVLEMNCGNVDIDKDGKMDCIATGRLSTIHAFNPRDGTVFWSGDDLDSVMRNLWNNYNILVLPDFDNDGVPELLMAHGGDPNFAPEQTARFSGRLILINGANGKMFGKRYLDMPDSKETYMSPVLHQRADGSQYILFGHGGETVPGTFFAISLPDLYRYVMKLDKSAQVPQTKGAYSDWGGKTKSDIGLIEIYRSQKKGVMVPPVCVDITKDGVRDILMSAYDGTIAMYDGENLKLLWKTTFEDTESYSTPAPAYFNDDDVPDFMLHENVGAWPDYTESTKYILDGKTGAVLWSVNGTHYDMTSDLVVRTTEDNRDIYVVHMAGRKSAEKKSKAKKLTSNDISHKRRKRAQSQILPNHRRKNGPQYPRPTAKPHPPVNNNRRKPAPYPRKDYADYAMQDDRYNNYRPKYPTTQYHDQYHPYGYPDQDHNTEPADPFSNYYYDSRYPENYGRGPSTGNGDYEDLLKGFTNGDGQDIPADIDNDRTMSIGDGTRLRLEGDEDNHDNDHAESDKPDHLDAKSKDDDDDDDDDDEDSGTASCTANPDDFATEVFLMDRTVAAKPLLVYKYQPIKEYSDFTDKERKAISQSIEEEKAEMMKAKHGHDSGRKKRRANIRAKRHGVEHKVDKGSDVEWSNRACTLIAPGDRSTGAIGDLDGDGTLDMVIALDSVGMVRDAKSGSYIRSQSNSGLVKINLETRLRNSKDRTGFIQVDAKMPKSIATNKEDKEISELKLRPFLQQPWTAYMGRKGDSIYDENDDES